MDLSFSVPTSVYEQIGVSVGRGVGCAWLSEIIRSRWATANRGLDLALGIFLNYV